MSQTNETQQPIVWDDNTIIAAYQRAFGSNPDVHHMALLTWMRDEMQARIDELESQLATVEEWQPLPDGEYMMQGWGDHTYTLYVGFDGAELEAWSNADEDKYPDGTPKVVQEIGIGDYRLCRRTPAEKGENDAQTMATGTGYR